MTTKSFLEEIVRNPSLIPGVISTDVKDLETEECKQVRVITNRLLTSMNVRAVWMATASPQGLMVLDITRREIVGVPPVTLGELVLLFLYVSLLWQVDIDIETSLDGVFNAIAFEGVNVSDLLVAEAPFIDAIKACSKSDISLTEAVMRGFITRQEARDLESHPAFRKEQA